MRQAELSLVRLAEGQHGVFSRAEAVHAGLTPGQIDWRIASGRWERVQPGVYRIAGTPLTWWGLLRAATSSPGCPAVVSHETAARVHGFSSGRASSTIDVTIARSGVVDLGGVRVHRSRSLPAEDVREVSAVSVTTPERTIIDCAAQLDLAGRYAMVDAAICAGVTGRARLGRKASELRNGRKGVASIEAITAERARTDLRSFLERHAARVFSASDLPRPIYNAPIRIGGRLLGILDAFWEQALLGAEFDGLRFHSPPSRRNKDVERDRRLLTQAGITVMRFTYEDVMRRPDQMVEQVRAALRRRGGVSAGLGRPG